MRQITSWSIKLRQLNQHPHGFLFLVFLLLFTFVFSSFRTLPDKIDFSVHATSAAPLSITDNAFTPREITITVGDTINWKNNGQTSHSVTEINGKWNSGTIAPAQSFSYTFVESGVYEYRCAFHPGMSGKVTVLPFASPHPTLVPSPPSAGNTPPECMSLSATPTFGGARLQVNFIGKGRDTDGIIREMEFNFGDRDSQRASVANGGTNQDTLTSTSHTFGTAGTYNATLRVKDNSGQANEWSGTPDSCKVKIEVQGSVLGGTTTTPMVTSGTPSVLPKAGVSEWLTFAYFLSGITGMGLKWIDRKLT